MILWMLYTCTDSDGSLDAPEVGRGMDDYLASLAGRVLGRIVLVLCALLVRCI